MEVMVRETAQFRASAGERQAFGATPADALTALMAELTGDIPTPIVIRPYNRGMPFSATLSRSGCENSRRDGKS